MTSKFSVQITSIFSFDVVHWFKIHISRQLAERIQIFEIEQQKMIEDSKVLNWLIYFQQNAFLDDKEKFPFTKYRVMNVQAIMSQRLTSETWLIVMSKLCNPILDVKSRIKGTVEQA